MIRIESIVIIHMLDEMPDTSFLGEYTDKIDDWVISRKHDEFVADLDDDETIPEPGREYRFFKPYAGGETPGTKLYREYGMSDYKRMESLDRGDYCFLGIMAEAEVSYSPSECSRRCERLTSGGLWGVESDSGDYLNEIARQEIEDLKKHLGKFGVDLSDFDELAKEALEEEPVTR